MINLAIKVTIKPVTA